VGLFQVNFTPGSNIYSYAGIGGKEPA